MSVCIVGKYSIFRLFLKNVPSAEAERYGYIVHVAKYEKDRKCFFGFLLYYIFIADYSVSFYFRYNR